MSMVVRKFRFDPELAPNANPDEGWDVYDNGRIFHTANNEWEDVMEDEQGNLLRFLGLPPITIDLLEKWASDPSDPLYEVSPGE